MSARSAATIGLALALVAVSGCGSGDQNTGFSLVDAQPDAGLDDGAAWDGYPSWDASGERPEEVEAGDPGPPYPVILHHGFSGWDTAKVLGWEYFYGVRDHLAQQGETEVYATSVDPYQSTELRAHQLALRVDEVLEETGKDKVNIVAHSQGGLDTRYLISTLGYGDRVASLTTISTPHRGTRVADAILKLVPDWTDGLINAIADILGREILDANHLDSDMRKSLEALSEDYVRRVFNVENPDDPRVEYYSYAGRSNDSTGIPDCDGAKYEGDPAKVDHIHLLLKLTGEYLKKPGQGVICPNDNCANDGMVTVQSSRWGQFMGCVPADHFDEVGQIMLEEPNAESGYDHRAFYQLIIERLRQRAL